MNKNLREFSTPLQKTVWRSYIEIFHPEYSTSQMEEGELKQSCRELYAYTTEGMADIVDYTEVYEYIPPERLTRYEVYCFHHIFLENLLSHACVKEKDYIVIDNAVYDDMLDSMRKRLKKSKILDRSFTMKELLKSLDRKGMHIERGDKQSRITNSRYPNMFYASALLEETAANYYKRTKRSPQQFRQLDFLSIGNDKRRITLEDVVAPMYDNEKEYVYKFICELKKKVRLSQSCKIWYYRTAKFRYKSKPLFYIWWGKSYAFELGMELPAPDTAAYNYLLEKINKLPDAEEFKAFCREHIKTCKGCNTDCIRKNAYKKNWIVFDRPMNKLIRSCEQHITVYEFTEQNYNYYIQLADIYIQMIDLGLM